MGARRVPKQQRSKERYERILDAAAALIDERGKADLPAASIVAAAGVSTGAFYAYFDDADAVVDALVDRHLAGFVAIVRSTFASNAFGNLDEVSDALIDAFADYYRSEPGYRAIWHGGALRPRHHEADRANDHYLVATNAELLLEHRLVDSITGPLLDHLHINWRIGDALLLDAFARDPAGDQRTIDETKRILRLRNQHPAVDDQSAASRR